MSRSSSRPVGKRICRKCRETKPVTEYADGERHCTDCIEARPVYSSKAQRNRARNRAYALLARKHKEEFDALYQAELLLMKNENGIAEMLAGLR